jgi:drug/metabolite transporter (DMT)-like permease
MTKLGSLSAPMQSVVWMLGQCTCFAIMALSARALAPSMSAYEMIFFRAVFGFLFMLPWMKAGLGHEMRLAFGTGRTGFLVVRNVLAFAAMALWFIGIGLMPISDAVAIQFTLPLFVALGAWLFLGETVGPRRWIAVAVGFLGALAILRPGIIDIGFGTLAVTGSALVYAAVHLMTKSLSGRVPGTVIVFFMNIAMLPLGLACALPVWVWPVWADLPWLFALGSVGSLAHICMTRAYRTADASFVESMDFARLPIAALLGWIFFRETSDVWTWVGAAMIFAAISWSARHEAREAGKKVGPA